MTLEEAQRRKHDYIAAQIELGPGRRMLDLGCGWGALLNSARERGAEGVGVALSEAQVASCRRHGLDVHLRDARTVDATTYGTFDAVASLGAWEHFCSPDEYRAGRQEQIYRDLFSNIASVLPTGGRFYLQTMVFGRNMIPLEEVSEHAPRDSDAYILFLLGCQFPGSLLPTSARAAGALRGSRTSASSRARAGASTTSRRSRSGTSGSARRACARTCVKLRLLPHWLRSSTFRHAFTSGVSANKVCFERELLDHFRLVFEKTADSPASATA